MAATPTSFRDSAQTLVYWTENGKNMVRPTGIYNIYVGIAFLGITYAICALIPPLAIREMKYDPKGTAVEFYGSSQQSEERVEYLGDLPQNKEQNRLLQRFRIMNTQTFGTCPVYDITHCNDD